MNNLGISIFLPVYNEEKILKEHVLLVYDAAKKLKRPFELVIVDDSSKDNTPKIAKLLENKHSEIRHRRFENGPSRRENLAVAMSEAKFPIVIFMDMDLSVDLSYLPNLVLEMDKGFDIVTGSRYMGLKPHREFYRLMLSRAYNRVMRNILGSKVRDHQCGFKAMKKEVLKDLRKELGYDKNFIRGWFWDAELLIRAQRKGYQVMEFPVTWDSGKQSSFTFRREIKMMPYIMRFIFNKPQPGNVNNSSGLSN